VVNQSLDFIRKSVEGLSQSMSELDVVHHIDGKQ
jgi:hypothetical protein